MLQIEHYHHQTFKHLTIISVSIYGTLKKCIICLYFYVYQQHKQFMNNEHLSKMIAFTVYSSISNCSEATT